MPDVTMPQLSDSMEEGTILRWLKRSGDQVARGEQLAEIDTDTATLTFEAEAAGVLETLAREGETLPVGAAIARIGEVVPGTAKGDVSIVDPTRAQQTVARRMAEAKATIPEFTLTAEIDMEAALAVLRDLGERDGEAVPGPEHLVLKACALALRDVPRANAAYKDSRFELYSRVNVGLAVAAQDSLVVPTIFDADRKPVDQIAREARALAEKAREGQITPPEVGGATFTVADLGAYGVTASAAIIHPPQAAILAVGAIEPRAAVREGAVVVRHRLTATLTCDHRILYGADAARFLTKIRELLEQPAALLG